MRKLICSRQRGFTLIEAIMVITITGIIASVVAIFIRRPVEAYIDTARRAALTDAADTVTRRIGRDVQAALPNSVRVDGPPEFLEFIPVHDGGRYRAEVGTAVGEDPLDFTDAADTRFDVLGPAVTVLPGDSLVVYSLGVAGASAYENPLTVRRVATAGNGLSQVTFTPIGAALPFASPGSRFQIVGTPVSYACDLATGTLWRYSGYTFQVNQPTNLAALDALPGVTRAALATNVTAPCRFAYAPGPLQHNGLVSIALSITQSGESVVLQHQVNVDNAP